MSLDISPTSVNAEYGKINSASNDSRFSVSQTLSFPVVYSLQKKALAARTEGSALNEKRVSGDIRKSIASIYYKLRVMERRKALMLQSDSLYGELLRKQEQRFKLGESTILEKTAAEAMRMQISYQLKALSAGMQNLELQLSSLMNCRQIFLPEAGEIKMAILELPDDSLVMQHPVVLWQRQKQKTAWADYKMSRSKWIPSFMLGYNNQSLTGYQNVNGSERYFNPGDRFSSFVIGLNIPLFFKAVNAGVKSSYINYLFFRKEYEDVVLEQHSAFRQLQVRYKQSMELLDYYEKSALGHASLLAVRASEQFAAGALSYIEWAALINQSVEIRSAYLNAVDEWNEIAVELNSYSNKN